MYYTVVKTPIYNNLKRSLQIDSAKHLLVKLYVCYAVAYCFHYQKNSNGCVGHLLPRNKFERFFEIMSTFDIVSSFKGLTGVMMLLNPYRV